MEKRSAIRHSSELEATEEEPKIVRLVLLRDVKLRIVGKVTGKEYNFSGVGAEVNVDEVDAVGFLGRTSQSCCTGLKSSYFDIVR